LIKLSIEMKHCDVTGERSNGSVEMNAEVNGGDAGREVICRFIVKGAKTNVSEL
jgi:hypothetical protein